MKWIDEKTAILSDNTFCWIIDNRYLMISGNNWKQNNNKQKMPIPLKYDLLSYDNCLYVVNEIENLIKSNMITMNANNVFSIKLSELKVSELNVRTNEVDTGIEELADSIKLFGLMQPIVLKGEYGNPPYDVIVGQRRYLAHKLLQKEEINSVFSGVVDDIGAIMISLSENMHRVELDHADKAKTITKLYLHFNRDENEVKKSTGLSIRTIRDYIKLEEQATETGLKMLKEGKISKPDLKRVIDIAQGDENKVATLLNEIGNLSRHEKDRAVKIAKSNSKASVEEIVKEAKKPKIEETVMLNLPMKVTKALRKACDELALEKEALTMNALTEWLINNNFLDK